MYGTCRPSVVVHVDDAGHVLPFSRAGGARLTLEPLDELGIGANS